MRVRVIEKTKAYWNYAIREFVPGEEFDGDIARHLAANAPAGTVKVIEADPEPDPTPDPEPDPTPTGPADGDEPPVDGTIDDLMAWVDGDAGRAAAAVAAEQAKDKPRSTVIKRLAALTE